MIDKIVCSAPGKIILTGEHSVVYGEPALLATVGLRSRAVIKKIGQPVIKLYSDKLGGIREGSVKSVTEYWRQAYKAWERFEKSGNDKELNKIRSDKYVAMKCAVGLCLGEVQDFNKGLKVELTSELPIISGFGSSAYVAAVVIGAVGKLLGLELSKEKLNKRVYEVEKIMHGKPSGGDPTIIINGGFIKFRKANGEFEFERLSIKTGLIKNIYLINSGKSVESTGEMVQNVTNLLKRDKKYQKVIKKMGKVVEEFIAKLLNNHFDTRLLKVNERLLEELGVVSKRAMRIIQLIEEAGGVAKISGGGGVRKGSGLLLAYHKDPNKLRDLISSNSWEYFKTDLGGEGWRIE